MAETNWSRENKRRINDWILEKWRSQPRCPFCQEDHWEIGEELISSIPFEGGVFKFARGAYPVLTILCTNCGYVANFSAVKVGLIKGEESNAD